MEDDFNLKIPTIVENDELLPVYASSLASGADVKAAIDQDLIIPAGGTALIPTGLRVAIPEGYEIQIRPRSGLALKHQVTVLNTPGTIDADYRGEIAIILINHGNKDFIISPGMRIAQLVVAKVLQAHFVSAEELTATERGVGGFGHTGVN